jgi:hypothetical protein
MASSHRLGQRRCSAAAEARCSFFNTKFLFEKRMDRGERCQRGGDGPLPIEATLRRRGDGEVNRPSVIVVTVVKRAEDMFPCTRPL